MKKIYLALIVILATICFSLNASAFDGHNLRRHHRSCGTCDHKVVGAPLDGGLLALLGAAGIAYYITRKKKVSKE